MTDLLAEPLDRLLADQVGPEALRKILHGGPLEPVKNDLAQLGYEDALVDEADDGLGLQLTDLAAMLVALGRRMCPVPLGQSVVARALLARAGIPRDIGHTLLLTPARGPDGHLSAMATPLALGATHALLDLGSSQALVSLATAIVVPIAPGLSLAADLVWNRLPADASIIEAPLGPLRPTAALLAAAAIAGMIAGVVDLTSLYSATRCQFGKPIADFQAIQQQLAVLAEEAAAAAMAAAIGCDGPGPLANPFAAGVAKMRTSMAAARVSSIAHAVHGAMGFSEEYDLQLFSRRLAEERLANGSEAYWAEEIGRAHLADGAGSSVEFVRRKVDRLAE